MKRIWLFGASPLPVDPDGVTHGAGIRTWQFLKPLLRREDISIVAVCLRSGDEPAAQKVVESKPFERLTRCDVPFEILQNEQHLRDMLKDKPADIVIGVGSILPVFIASRHAGKSPFWADFFGDPLAEMQSKADRYPEERSRNEIFHVWKLYNAIVHRADKLSAVSEPQRCAVIGHLGLSGRLNRFTAGYEFVHTIPCGVDEDDREAQRAAPAAEKPAAAPPLPPEAFAVRWSGSYNTWADIPTLFAGIERAMASNTNIFFLSTGGGIKGYNEQAYDEFSAFVARSKFRERFILRGWVPNHEVAYWDSRSDLGINVDRFTYEGVLGSRNRIIQLLRRGIPVLTTPLTEVSKVLAQRGFVHTFPIGDAAQLAAQLLKLANAKEALKTQASSAREFVIGEYGFSRTLAACVEWLTHAALAPDNAERARHAEASASEAPPFLNEAEHWSHFGALNKELDFLLHEKARLDALRATFPYKLLSGLKRLFGR